MAYAEFDACVAAGLDLEKWQRSKDSYDKELKVLVMAWHRLNRLIRIHSDEAVVTKIKKDQAKK